MRGYAGKFLEVDLSNENFKDVTLDEQILKQYIGGRGLAAKILWDRLGDRWETIDPLGPENLLLILTGPLTGFVPGARICISGKSPQCNGIVGSTISCEFPIELKCVGYDGLIITGKATKPSYIFITDSGAEIKDASRFWGKRGEETLKILIKEGREELETKNPKYGEWKEPSALYIGPGGENKSRMAHVSAKRSHAAGFGGYGSVMGSKNLKAISVKGIGPLPDVADMEKMDKLRNEVLESNFIMSTFRWWGMGGDVYDVGNLGSREPIRNWQEEWHDIRSLGINRIEERLYVKRYWGDFGCPTTCMRISMSKTGPFKGAITSGPLYEMQACVGVNLGIFTPEEICYMVALMDGLGLCGIQTGNILGFVGELYERGILTKTDLDSIEPTWGNVKAFADLAQKIAAREGIGDLLAEGTYRAALKIKEKKGVDVTQYAITYKGTAPGAHGPRSGTWMKDISYPCSVQPGDHCSSAALPVNTETTEFNTMLADSGVFCLVNTPENVFEFIEAVTGWKITPDEWFGTMARRILHLQRAALIIGGPDVRWDPTVDDDNPPRFYDSLPSGPYAGSKLDKKAFQESKRQYYEAVGWDENGIPSVEELKHLGLEKVAKKIEKMGLYKNL